MADNTAVYTGTGRRKEATARVRLVPGTGKVTINGRDALDYFGRQQLIGAGQKAPRDHSGKDNCKRLEFTPQGPRPIGHEKQNEAVEETEPVGNHIGEVESVPNII